MVYNLDSGPPSLIMEPFGLPGGPCWGPGAGGKARACLQQTGQRVPDRVVALMENCFARAARSPCLLRV